MCLYVCVCVCVCTCVIGKAAFSSSLLSAIDVEHLTKAGTSELLDIPTVTTQWRQHMVCVQGWRWSFYISGIPGVVLGLLILLTVREPPRRTLPTSLQSTGGGHTVQDSACQKLACTLKPFMTFSVILLCLGGSIRNAGEARTVFLPHLSQSG